MQTKYMKEAYGLLFEIETGMRQYIELTMKKTYGIGWYIQGPLSMNYKTYSKRFDSFYYHELISMLRSYPCFDDIPKEVYFQLLRTVPIRNKIAHCTSINDEEFKNLQEAHDLVIIHISPLEKSIN